MKNAVALLLVCFGLVACGQTGPLYLPQPTQEQPVIEPVEPAPAPLSTPAPSGSPAPEAVQETTTANPA